MEIESLWLLISLLGEWTVCVVIGAVLFLVVCWLLNWITPKGLL
jgi:hypothetical protein